MNNSPQSIENMVRSAGDFVEVDRYLRPAVMEQTRAEQKCRTAWRRGGIAATVVLFLAIPLGIALTNFSEQVVEQDMSRIESLNTNLNQSNWSWGMVHFQEKKTERARKK